MRPRVGSNSQYVHSLRSPMHESDDYERLETAGNELIFHSGRQEQHTLCQRWQRNIYRRESKWQLVRAVWQRYRVTVSDCKPHGCDDSLGKAWINILLPLTGVNPGTGRPYLGKSLRQET